MMDRHNFENFQNANNYNTKAKLQCLIANKLIEFASNKLESANSVIDIGCGTGFIGRGVLSKFGKLIDGLEPSIEMAKLGAPYYKNIINTRLEDFNQSNNRYDFALSSMALHWVPNYVENLKRVFKNTEIYFAIPLEGSLFELNSAFKDAGLKSPILQFKNPKLEPFFIQTFEEKFQSALLALKHFNLIGAKNPFYQGNKISHNEVKLLNQNFCKTLTWKIGFFNIKKGYS